ncbi:MAG: hypothetical protein ACL9RN_00700 [Cylindrospermopsis raciborskii]|uniref:hypothetical protein n=1 Tax=Cylindrospermopsis raciborskii TaxID=77022 RepID=UPI003D0AA14B
MAIATAIKTPVANNIFSAKYLLSCAESIYNEVVQLKQQLSGEIEQPETLENITITSEKISKIQRRFSKMDSLPDCLNKASVNSTLKKLNSWKETKLVQKLSKDYTDGDKAKLDDEQFAIQLVEDTDKLNLVLEEGIKSTSLEISLAALLLRA